MASEPDYPSTALDLMRSRFAAFARGDADWLMLTWHPQFRPAELVLDRDIAWRGLQIVDTVAGGVGDDTGVVEFRATYFEAGALGVVHERSSFVRSGGRWLYTTGEILSD